MVLRRCKTEIPGTWNVREYRSGLAVIGVSMMRTIESVSPFRALEKDRKRADTQHELIRASETDRLASVSPHYIPMTC